MGAKIDTIEGIGPAYREKLAKAGITRTSHLLDKCADAKGRAAVAKETGLKDDQLLKWVNLADLMRVKGVGPQFSELLEVAGVDTVKELKARKPENLHPKLAEANAARKLVRRVPALAEVARWVAAAKGLEGVITH